MSRKNGSIAWALLGAAIIGWLIVFLILVTTHLTKKVASPVSSVIDVNGNSASASPFFAYNPGEVPAQTQPYYFNPGPTLSGIALPDTEYAPVEATAPADVLCVALAVFTESRGESTLGQALVASTAWNRANATGVDACDVVSASNQYHVTLSADPWLIDNEAWERSVAIAESVRSGDYDVASCYGATGFHSTSVDPKWGMKVACKVGNHIFYRR